MRFFHPAMLLAFPLITTHVVVGQNLLINPSFEEPAGSYFDLPGGSTHLVGWTTLLNGVEIITSDDIGLPFPVASTIAHGRQAVDLAPVERLGGGGIRQTFSTEPGQEYHLTLSLGTAARDARVGTANFDVTVGGVTESYSLFTQSSDFAWTEQSLTFTATGNISEVSIITMDDPRFHFAAIDNVSVVQVPEPSSSMLLLLTLGTLAKFRNRARFNS